MNETYDQTITTAEAARPGIEDKIEHRASGNFMSTPATKRTIVAREILRCSFKALGWPRPLAGNS